MNDGITVEIGSKFGCFTVIEAYQKERTTDKNISIENEKNHKLYKVQCKCGKIHIYNLKFLQRKRWRDCGKDCGARLEKDADNVAAYLRKKDESYDLISLNEIHDSLEIVECIDDHVEMICPPSDKRKKKDGIVYLKKRFRCKCYLCGREYEFLSDEFKISNNRHSLDRSYHSIACCECRKDSSSFQWITVSLLKENRIPYRVEFSFQDLLSENDNPLRFDFVVFDDENNIKCLIECQGEQHFKLVRGCGGYAGLELIKKRDEIKRQYAKNKGLLLIEIPYTHKSYDEQREILYANGILNDA
ncbi:MAG: hypothetical protein E7599_04795 [Ruminococcaceae bacterium]|nr:hypothetical protein [Oscillospiraceae bacterium]